MRFKCLFIVLIICATVYTQEDDTVVNSDAETIPETENNQVNADQRAPEENPQIQPEQTPDDTGIKTPEDEKTITEKVVPVPDNHDNQEQTVPNNTENAPPEKPKPPSKRGRSGRLTYEDPTYDPMTSRIAPEENGQRGTGGPEYVITEQRLKEIRAHFMYPYYDRGGNADDEGDYQKYIQASSPQVHKNLNFQFPFYGFRYNYTRVSLNGYLEFSDPPPNYNYPLVFPVKDWPKRNDPAFIGIFFSKCRVGNLRDEDIDRREPGVYFRQERDLRGRKDRMGVEIRERVRWDFREGVIGADTFDPKHAIIATWKNVSFAGGFGNALYKTNTFQLVLATDEVFTYAMFNYLNLDWTTHTEAGGDTTTGEGGVSAFVGFNAGNGTRSREYKPYSQDAVIRDLTSTGFGNGFKGRHMFRIDENILVGTCNKDIDGANLPLVFAPESGNMLGGTVINITGPCFKLTDQVTCKFDVADVVYGVVVDSNRAICVQPKLYVEGYVRFEIAIGPGTYKWKGRYYVETPSTATQKIFFKDLKYNERSPGQLRMTWAKENLTVNDNAPLRISLWGYRETTIRPEFLYIAQLAENVPNSGEYNIIPTEYRNREDEFLTDMKFGFIQINLTESIKVNSSLGEVEITPIVWSRPIPLAWYFGPQWERMYGKQWPDVLCDQWLKDDRYLKNFAHELPQCPCTLQQALADKGKFMPDFDCDKDSNPQCYYHQQAMHCVKTGSPTLEGAEQQCCYDKNSFLMLSYDNMWGSSPRRSHNLGNLPWNEATKVPTLSQWYHDMVPKYLCCLWQEEQAVGCETLRFERRPSQDCVAYQGPGIAGVYGDPHIVTFDDVEYTFNGKGEFVLVKSTNTRNDLQIQGRFEQMPMNAYGEVRASQLSSIVAKGNTSTVVEVRRRPKEARWRYRLDVIADGKRVYFDRPALKFQHFPGVTVYTPTYILNQSEVIIMFDSGAGVEVVDNEGYLSARVYLPWTFINKTAGLFGNWSFMKEDDFTLPDGTTIGVPVERNKGSTDAAYDFGLKWMLDDVLLNGIGKSLFFREFGRTAATYNNKTFKPENEMDIHILIPQNRSEQINRAYEICHEDNIECLYDYAMTLNRDLAHFTSNYKASIKSLKETSRNKIVSCGVLETPRFGRKTNFLFIPGTKVTFECNQDYILTGDPRRECLADGSWNVPEFGYTECLRQQEYSQRQGVITGGIVLAVLIPLILIILFIALNMYKKMNESEVRSWKYTGSKLSLARPYTPEPSDVTSFPSDKSSETSSTTKKRRSYDKSYYTGEPLKGLPETEFEEKSWDPNDIDSKSDAGSPQPSSVIYSQPYRHEQNNNSSSSPNLLTHDPHLYTVPHKPKDRFSSQSSIVTDV